MTIPEPSASTTERAEAYGAVLAIDARRRELAAILEEPFRAEENEEAGEHGAVQLAARAQAAAEARAEALVERFATEILGGDDAAWAAEAILAAEDEAERVHRLYDAMVLRSRRRERLVRAMLWPALIAYAKVAERTSKKGWKLPTTQARLVLRSAPASLEVTDRSEALRYVEREMGTAEAIERDVLAVRTEVRTGPLARWFEARRSVEPNALPPSGCAYEPAGDRLTLYRR